MITAVIWSFHLIALLIYLCRLEDFQKRSNNDHVLSSVVIDTMSDVEKKLLGTHQVVMVRGKRSHPVPILIPPDCVSPLEILTDPKVRYSAGVKDTNPYVFANTGKDILYVVSLLTLSF
jgi:hypothetical protein